MVLLLVYSHHSSLLCVRTGQIHRSCTYVTHKIYLRKTTVLEKNASCFLNTYTHFSRIVSAERFFPFYVYKVDYNSRRLFFSYHVYFIKEDTIAHFPDI